MTQDTQGICIGVIVVGLALGRIVELGFRIVAEKVMGFARN